MKLGTLLRQQRDHKKLSQCQIAEQVGISQSTYFAWENDRSLPSAKYLDKLASVLEIDLKLLIPSGLNVTLTSLNKSNLLPITLNAQTLYEDLTASQRHIILLQQHRIDQLESENQHLREQLTQLT